MTRRLCMPLVLVAASLVMAGCSYNPARVETRPLIEVDGYSGHRHYRGDDRRYRDRHRRVERHYYYDDRRHYYDDRRHDRRGRGLCPPGLRMQGRC
jgi:hypothetical protein